MSDLIGQEWEDLLPHVEDSIRNGDFSMNYPWQSNYHDHLCLCPGCRGLDQDDYERSLADALKIIAEGIASLSAPLLVLHQDDLRHTSDAPFCPDVDCPCHSDAALFEKFIARPVREGRLKTWEAQELLWPEL